MFTKPNRVALVAAIVAIIGVLGLTTLALIVVDLRSNGSYTTRFNYQMRDRAQAAHLIGQPETNVEAVLGSASYVYTSPGHRTFDYYPYALLPAAKFQVHCTNGVVTGLEMLDD